MPTSESKKKDFSQIAIEVVEAVRKGLANKILNVLEEDLDHIEKEALSANGGDGYE